MDIRLSLASGIACPESDIAGASTIYLVPHGGDTVHIFDGIARLPFQVGPSICLPLDANSAHTGYHQAGKIFDLFIFEDSGAVVLGSGPAWSSDTVRASDIAQTDGIFVNSASIDLRFGTGAGDIASVPSGQATYVGSFRCVANGLTSDTKAKRLLFNAYNAAHRILKCGDSTSSWDYSAAAWRQARGSADNQVEILLGLSGVAVSLDLISMCKNSTATARGVWGAIGLDSTTPSDDCFFRSALVATGRFEHMVAQYRGCPSIGYHTLKWLERGAGADVQTWYGLNDNYPGGGYRFGLAGGFLN